MKPCPGGDEDRDGEEFPKNPIGVVEGDLGAKAEIEVGKQEEGPDVEGQEKARPEGETPLEFRGRIRTVKTEEPSHERPDGKGEGQIKEEA
jgi:hypothetical protein